MWQVIKERVPDPDSNDLSLACNCSSQGCDKEIQTLINKRLKWQIVVRSATFGESKHKQ